MRIPGPFPDENLFSILSRYQIIHGMSEASLRRHILGDKYVSGRISYRHMLKTIDFFSQLFNINTTEFIFNHTMIPMYSPFLTEASERTLKAFITPDLLVNRCCHKFCPACVYEDIKKFGIAYWHREHQADGIVTCHSHGEVLQSDNFPVRNLNIAPHLPTPWCEDIKSSESKEKISQCKKTDSMSMAEKLQFHKHQHMFCNDFSKLVYELLICDIRGIKYGILEKVYKQRLKTLGLITADNQFYIDKIRSYLYRFGEIDISHWLPMGSSQPSDRLFTLYLDLIIGGYSEGYFSGNKFNPLVHIVIIRTLFDSFEDWKNSIGEHSTDDRIVNYLYSEYGD